MTLPLKHKNLPKSEVKYLQMEPIEITLATFRFCCSGDTVS